MSQDISKERQLYGDFIRIVGGMGRITIHRANGDVEGPVEIMNQVTGPGLDNLAARSIVASHTLGFVNIAIGSGTAAGSLGSTALIHEVTRKASLTPVTSFSNIVLTNTWGGFADTITSVALEEAGIFNSVDSGQGTMLNKLTGVNATLANSDILNLEMTFRIGSHAIP